MNRWWTDPQIARSTLERVDSSDPVQGVGTAVLGYHGLAEGVLQPLTHRTLLDVEGVSKALDGLDIAPVAKALANATRPVVGDAAEKYGELLAQDLHKQAVESTGRLILNLVSTGMAWPTAIDRAASVHGVPVDRLGKAGSALRAPALAKIAQADIADRALMEYAAHVGKREYTPDVVSKASQQRERFREEDVNRDALGRFADKPDRSLPSLSVEAKRSFAERQARRQKRQRRQQRAANATQAQETSRGSLLDALMARETAPAATAAAVAQTKTKPVDGLDAAMDAALDTAMNRAMDKAMDKAADKLVTNLLNRKRDAEPAFDAGPSLLEIPDDIPFEDGTYPGWVGGSRDQQLFVLVDKSVAEQVAAVGGFNWAQLQETGLVFNTEPLDRERLQYAVLDYSRQTGQDDPLNDLAIVAFDGLVAWDEDFTAGDKMYLAEAGLYSISRRNETVGLRGLEFDDYLDLDLKAYSVPGMTTSPKTPIQLPHITVKIDNDKEFKNLPGQVTKSERIWRESDVRRDELGRFAEENRARPVRSVEERRARRERRQRRQQRQVQQLSQAQAGSLLDGLMQRQESRAADRPAAERSAPRGISAEDAALDRAMDRSLDRVANQAMDRALDRAMRKVQDRQNSLEDFRFAHEEWKQTKAVRFSNEDDMATFTEIFDFDPYTGKSLGLGGVIDPGERQDAVDFVLSGRLKPTGDVVEGMYYSNTNAMVGEPIPAEAAGTYSNIAETPYAAYGFAQAAADEMNKAANDATREWMPLVQVDNEHRQFTMYRPMIVEVMRRDEDVVVLGNDADWAALRRGENVSLEALPGYNEDPEQPGQGLFKELFYAVGENESVGRDSELHEKSDFYVRAFRIKR
jgi:hypothetical protein